MLLLSLIHNPCRCFFTPHLPTLQSLSQISALREGFAALTERAPSQVDDLQAQQMDGISPADAEHMQGFVEAVRRRQEANQL